TEPGKDVEKPVNSMLKLVGRVNDDIGVKEVTLRMRVVDGPALQPKPYRSDKELRLASGGYPRGLGYLDHMVFAKLKDATGQPAKLQPGAVIEYWLEAHDNCDYPQPNSAESAHFRVKLTTPDKDEKKQQQQQQQADKDQQQHNENQDKE